MKVRDHVRKTGVHFYKIGIGIKDNDAFLPWSNEYTSTNPKKTWKIRTLSSIMAMLGHTNVGNQDTVFDHGYVRPHKCR